MGRDLIVFGEDWGGLPSSTQHLIIHLAKSRKIVWVNSIGLRRPRLARGDIKRIWNKLTALGQNNRAEYGVKKPAGENFHVIYPRTLPAPRGKIERAIATRLLSAQINPVVKRYGLQSPILWTSLPTAVDLVGTLGESAVVYYCGDDFSALAGVDHDTVSARERELVLKADLIFAASEKLAQRFPPQRTRLLPHGVDNTLFSHPAPRAHDLPNDGRPIAGFYGSISEWLNMELLQATIQALPEWRFVFIGKAVIDVTGLTRFNNVTMLGERPHRLLPQYSQHWTASLLPFTLNAQIQSCNPLKLSEYLAAGRPIVSTSFPAIQHYRGLVQIADNKRAMVEALRAACQLTEVPAFCAALRSTVAAHGWETRAQDADFLLETL